MRTKKSSTSSRTAATRTSSTSWCPRASTRRWPRWILIGTGVLLSEWEDAIETALSNKLAQRAAAREAQRKAAAKEIAEFTGEFLNAARKCFELIDKDGGDAVDAEIVRASAYFTAPR